MPNISYTPSFQHKDWIDNEDIVQAGGENGFNARFHALEDEFRQLSRVLSGLIIRSRTFTLSFSPDLTPPSRSLGAWETFPGGAVKPLGGLSAVGGMFIQLPDRAKIQSMTVVGNRSGIDAGSFDVLLIRLNLENVDQQVAGLSLSDKTGNFQVTVPPFTEPDISVIDNSTNSYFIEARVLNAAASSRTELGAIRILCSLDFE